MRLLRLLAIHSDNLVLYFFVLFLFYLNRGLTINTIVDHQHTQHMSSTAGTLQNTKWQSCIDACMRCAESCEFCATSDLKERDVKMMASCAQMNCILVL